MVLCVVMVGVGGCIWLHNKWVVILRGCECGVVDTAWVMWCGGDGVVLGVVDNVWCDGYEGVE